MPKKAEEILNLYRWRGDLFSNSLQKWWFSFHNIVKTNFWRLRVSPYKQLIRLNWYTHMIYMIYSTDSSKYTYIHNSTEQIIARTNCKFFPTIIYFVRTKTFIYFVRINTRIYFFWKKRHKFHFFPAPTPLPLSKFNASETITIFFCCVFWKNFLKMLKKYIKKQIKNWRENVSLLFGRRLSGSVKVVVAKLTFSLHNIFPVVMWWKIQNDISLSQSCSRCNRSSLVYSRSSMWWRKRARTAGEGARSLGTQHFM